MSMPLSRSVRCRSAYLRLQGYQQAALEPWPLLAFTVRILQLVPFCVSVAWEVPLPSAWTLNPDAVVLAATTE
jgi:hypothetical protein